MLFLMKPDKISGRTLVINEEKNTVWAYINLPHTKITEIDCDVWVCNKIPAPSRSEIKTMPRDTPPPAPKEVLADGYESLPDITESDIRTEWLGGKCANIYIRGRLTVSMFPDAGECCNVWLNRNCGWGKRFPR